MFCNNCGKELVDNATFCPECGTKADMGAANIPPAGGMGNIPFNRAPGAGAAAGMGTFKTMGLVSGALALLSLFLNWVKLASDKLAQLGRVFGEEDGSFNFFRLMEEGEIGALGIATVVFIIVFLIFQLTNHPKLSLIGCIWMAFMLGLCFWAVGEANSYFVMYKYAIGFYLFVLATVLAFVSAIKGKKRV